MKRHNPNHRADFVRAWRLIEITLRRTSTYYHNTADVARIIATVPAPGYYLTPAYARRLYNHARDAPHATLSPKARALLRHVDMLRHRLGIDPYTALDLALRSPAPSFFIDPISARNLFYRYINK